MNTARGGIVDESALYRALSEGWIAGAGLDVFAQEPLQETPLAELDNVVLTAHIAAVTEDSILAMGTRAVEEVLRALDGRPALHAL